MNIINRFTLQTLKKNKVRTLVTIVGIILSTAMFTGVTSIVSSLQQYVIHLEIANEGEWEGRLNNLSREQAEEFCKKNYVASATVVDTVGYARLQDSLNESKPYLCVNSIEKNFTDFSPIDMIEGRMPEKSDELVLSKHLEDNGDIVYHVGDTITLEVGKRTMEDKEVGQETSLRDGPEDRIAGLQPNTYHIVGICQRPPFEPFSAPGYTAYTVDADDAYTSDVLFISKQPREILKQMRKYLVKEAGRSRDEIMEGVDYTYHRDLLNFRGQSSNVNYMQMLYIMGTILVLIIMVASVTLIYNSFSISVSERTKQFGLLKSIGATKKQIRHSVYFEGLCLCGIGIPIGVLGGLTGIGVTLHFVSNTMEQFLSNTKKVQLQLTVMPGAIVIAVAVALATVLISSMIPAARAVRMTPIDALRESRDVRIRRRNIRTGRWVYRLFGFEGLLANKNFKRNRKKYRLTVFSLSISVILFIVTGCFNGYMSESVRIMEQSTVTDIRLFIDKGDMAGVPVEKAKKAMEHVQDVDEAAYSEYIKSAYLIVDKEDLDEDFYEEQLKGNANSYIATHKNSDKVLIDAYVEFVDDASYERYLKENHMDVSRFMDSKSLCPIIWDEIQGMTEESSILKCHILKKNYMPKEIYCINNVKGYEYVEEYEEIDAEKLEFPFARTDNAEDEWEMEQFPGDKAVTKLSLGKPEIMEGISRKVPLGIGSIEPWNWGVTMVLPYSAMENISGKISISDMTEFNFKADNYKKAYSNLSQYIKNSSGFKRNAASSLYSERETADANRALLLVVDIFVYGFILLIALIVVANIFNTISTNIQLRRKEFAMLKSVGMAKRGFDRMMNFECLLYGVKSLLIGLPVSFLLCYLMSKSLQVGWNAAFAIPWGNVAVVVVSVFVMVFGSMLYAMGKIKRDNPIEALRNDNM